MARILLTSFSVVPGPDRHGVQLQHIVKALASRFQVDVLTVRVGERAYVEWFHKARMLRVPLPDKPLAEQVEAFRRAVARQLEGAEYDVVHFRDAWGGTVVLDLQRLLRFRTVFDVGRSTLAEPRPADGALADLLAEGEELCLQRADLVLVPTELGRSYLSKRYRGNRFVVVPPGVDVDRFDVELSEVHGPPRVVYLGPLAPGRGVRVLLRAMRDVALRSPAMLTLAGPIEPRFAPTLASAIDQLGLRERVEVRGAIDNNDVPRLLAQASVCVAPTAHDLETRPTACFPTKLLEYMACQCAVVAPRRPVVLEVIEEGVDGLLFEPGNPIDLAQQILRILESSDLRVSLAVSAHRAVRDLYPASATRRRLLEAYSRLIPMSRWKPLSESAAALHIPGTGSGATTSDRPYLSSDTDPTYDEIASAPPTTITRPPPEALGDPEAQDTALMALPPDLRAEMRGDEEPAEPWLVRAPGMPSALGNDEERTDSGPTPVESTRRTPSPVFGSGFVAGEIDSEEREGNDPEFVAAGDLLGGLEEDI